MPSVFIKTYGCQMNERDSEAVAAQLVSKGYSLAETEAVADVILLNTCSVRDMAEQKAINKMENLAGQFRKSRPNVILGFMGCMAQSRGQQLIDKLPDVDLVLGTQKFHRAADYLDELIAGKRDKIVTTEFTTIAVSNFVDAAGTWLTGDAPFTAKLVPEYAPYAEYDQLMRRDEWYGRD